ncbi:Polycystin cation channel PKD1/PKD2 domain-containing protein [Plasmodiophora brassicae]
MLQTDARALFVLNDHANDFVCFLKGDDVTINDIVGSVDSGRFASVDWLTASHRLIVEGDIDVVARMCQAGFNMNATCPLDGSVDHFTCFQLAGAVYDFHPTELAFEMMQTLACYADKAQTFRALGEFLLHVDVDPVQAHDLALKIVTSSTFPIIAALQAADVMTRASGAALSRRESFEASAEFFSDFAILLVNSLMSDHVAAVAVEVCDDDGVCAIDIALQTGNVAFVNDPMVHRVLANVWAVPQYLQQATFVEPGHRGPSIPLHHLILLHPWKLARLNRAKFLVDALGLLAFLVLYTVVCTRRIPVNGTVSAWEIAVWGLAAGFIVRSVMKAARLGARKYVSSGWHQMDVIGWAAFTLNAIWRIAHASAPSVSPASQTAADVMTSVVSVALWMRLASACTVCPSIGILTRMLNSFARDILVFLLLLFVTIMGFGISLSVAVGNAVGGYATIPRAMFTLYQSALGQFDFSAFAGLPDGQRHLGQVLLSLFLFVALVVLVNLLIAMMAGTYASRREQSGREFHLSWSELVWDVHQDDGILPPPFNTIVYLCAAIGACCRYAMRKLNVNRHRSQVQMSRKLDVIKEKGASELDDEVGSAFEFEADQATMSPEWICKRCLSVNVARTGCDDAQVVLQWMKSIQGGLLQSLRLLPRRCVVQCSKCNSMKRTTTPEHKQTELVSFAVFLLLIWLPLAAILAVPYLIEDAVKELSSTWAKNRKKSKPEESLATVTGSVPGDLIQLAPRRTTARTQEWLQTVLKGMDDDADDIVE